MVEKNVAFKPLSSLYNYMTVQNACEVGTAGNYWENWVLCTGSSHRQAAIYYAFKTSLPKLNKYSVNCGCSYSGLLKLPCIDAPRMLVVDPMHHLLQLKNWFEEGIVSNDSFIRVWTQLCLFASEIRIIGYLTRFCIFYCRSVEELGA